MADTAAVVETTIPGPAHAEHQGFTVHSNDGTADDIQRDLGAGEEATEPGAPRLKSGDVHKRIARTTYQREEASRRADTAEGRVKVLEEENARLRQGGRRDEAASRPTDDERQRYDRWKAGHDDADPKPVDSAFDDHNDYLDARDAWNERRFERRQARASAEREHVDHQHAVGRAAQAFHQRLDAEMAKDATFGEMVQKIQIPGEGPLFDVFLSPKTPVEDLVRHFDAHPQDLTDLIGMRPGRQLAELHRLIGRLEARAEAAQAGSVARVKTTTAHPPINPVVGTHVAARDEEPGDDATDEEWFAWQDRQDKARKR